MEGVDISGIDKATLLVCLARGTVPASFFTANGVVAPEIDLKAAKCAIGSGYIDYFSGRAIKTDLSEDRVDPWLYDRDAGVGKFAEIVEKLKGKI